MHRPTKPVPVLMNNLIIRIVYIQCVRSYISSAGMANCYQSDGEGCFSVTLLPWQPLIYWLNRQYVS